MSAVPFTAQIQIPKGTRQQPQCARVEMSGKLFKRTIMQIGNPAKKVLVVRPSPKKVVVAILIAVACH